MTSADAETRVFLSVAVPIFNEEATVGQLYQGITTVLSRYPFEYEILLIDDGSRDSSPLLVSGLQKRDRRVCGTLFSANRGKAAALSHAFRNARGEVLITMDADLQDDPEEIPRFLEKINEGYDLVVGWRHVRRDPWHKNLSSLLFNKFVDRSTDIGLHDINCGFKAYRRDLYGKVFLREGFHRYIPLLARGLGARMAEIPVRHHPRRFGRSKYGIERFPRCFLDLFLLLLTMRKGKGLMPRRAESN